MENRTTELDHGRTVFNNAYKSFFPLIYTIIKDYVKDREVAKDLTADVFVKLWVKQAEGNDFESLRGYLVATARNSCIDYLRKVARQKSALSELPYITTADESDQFERAEIKGDVLNYYCELLDTLPNQCKTIFKLVLEGKSNEEIAQALNITDKTVRNQKNLARNTLKGLLRAEISILLCFFKIYF